jgi:hypothetical protein
MIGYYYYTTKIRPYLTEPERSSYSFGFLTVLTIILFGFLVLRPIVSSSYNAYLELKSAASYNSALSEKMISLNQAKANFGIISSKLDQIEAAVPKGVSQPELIQELAADAGEAGATLNSTSFKDEDTFTMSLTGPTAGLTSLMEALEEGRVITLEGVQASLRQAETINLWDISVEGKAVYIQ